MNLKISQESIVKISWGALIFLSSIIVGFSTWMTTMQVQASSHQSAILELNIQKEEMKKIIERIDKNVLEIQIYLRTKKDKYK